MRQDEINTTVETYGIHADKFSDTQSMKSIQTNAASFNCVARAYTNKCDQRKCRSCLENYLDAIMKACF